MSIRSLLTAGLLCVAPALGAVTEKLNAVPFGWTIDKEADPSTPIALSLSLSQQNLDKLEQTLASVSTPGQASYGKYLDKAQVDSLFPISSSSGVIDFLKAAGISEIHDTGAAVNFKTTVGQANKLFDAKYTYFTSGGQRKLRTLQYTLPSDIDTDVALLHPSTYLGQVKANRAITSYTRREASPVEESPSGTSLAAACHTSITPACVKQLYNVQDYTPDPSSGSRIGFGSFLGQVAVNNDLYLFEKQNGIPHQSFTVTLIQNGTNNQNTSINNIGEANLDVQNIVGVAHPLPIHEFITGGSPPFIPNLDEPLPADNENEPYLAYYEHLLSMTNDKLPQVISNSYGDDEQTVPPKYANRVCQLIGLMGMRGITILESSGDTGVGAACRANDGSNAPQFTPTFPGTCPYLTSVGGTQAVAPEVAWNAGSGGFSNYFPTAWYQQQTVDNYLDQHVSNETKAYYSQFTDFKGRGFPDVSAHSLTPDYQVVYAGSLSPSGGTSAAAPVWAGIIGLLNDALLRAGKPALGFLNPFLYDVGFKGLYDITGGQSDGCTGINLQSGQAVPGGGVIPGAHWNATTGWDPVTGLGTPNFQALKQLVLSQ